MKHTKLFVGTACVASLFALGVSGHATTASQVLVYSVAKGNDHNLTTDYNRAQALLSQGYCAFQIVGELPTTSGTQIHSWYSATAGHYLTVDDSASLTALGYTEMDGTTGLYAASSTDVGAVPMYVWYNAQASHYHNTDANHVFNPAVYGNRSVAWYGFAAPASSTIPTITPTTTTKRTMGSADISNISAPTAIQTNMTVSGSGKGFHAKVSFNTATEAVSFGIQYDAHGAAPYTGKPSFLIENISSAATETGNLYTHRQEQAIKFC